MCAFVLQGSLFCKSRIQEPHRTSPFSGFQVVFLEPVAHIICM